MDGSRRVPLIFLLGFLSVCAWGAQPEEAATPTGEFQNAEALLEALEDADRDLTTLIADLRYVREFAIAGDEQTRLGTLYFQSMPPDESGVRDRRFAVDFTTLVVGPRIEDVNERYVFDGQWLLELDEKVKHFNLRQVVPPGEKFDPLRIGEGPFPIPIGQRREDILKRFTAALVSADDGLYEDEAGLIEFTKGMSQIRLEPREGYEDEIEFTEVRLWYQRNEDGRLLPRMARTTNLAGDESTVILTNIKVNEAAQLPAGKLDTTPPEKGWDGQVIEWRG